MSYIRSIFAKGKCHGICTDCHCTKVIHLWSSFEWKSLDCDGKPYCYTSFWSSRARNLNEAALEGFPVTSFYWLLREFPLKPANKITYIEISLLKIANCNITWHISSWIWPRFQFRESLRLWSWWVIKLFSCFIDVNTLEEEFCQSAVDVFGRLKLGNSVYGLQSNQKSLKTVDLVEIKKKGTWCPFLLQFIHESYERPMDGSHEISLYFMSQCIFANACKSKRTFLFLLLKFSPVNI